VDASIFDYELIEETGVRMNPGAPAHAKSWTRDMHTCIIVAPYDKRTLTSGYRVITTTSTPSSTFGFGKLVELGSEKRGALGTYRVVGMVNIFTMKTLGKVPDSKILHWILK
jgi:hypothetical protein